LINDAMGPPTKFAPRLPGADEATRTFGRVAQMAPLSSKLLDTGAKWHDSRVHKLAKLGFTAASVIGLLGYPNCSIPEHCIDARRLALFIVRSALRDLIAGLQADAEGVQAV
jgi:hypothetical protein